MKLILAIVLVIATVASEALLVKEIWEDKRYKEYESPRFAAYLKELGVNDDTIRATTNRYLPIVELKKLPDKKFTLITNWGFKNVQSTFELGKEFDEETFDGRMVKSVVTFEDGKMIHKQSGKPDSTIIREFRGNEMVETITVNDVGFTFKYFLEGFIPEPKRSL